MPLGYIKRKNRKKYGNSSWRQTIYTNSVCRTSRRDTIVSMRMFDSLERRVMFNLWTKDKIDTDKIFIPSLEEKKMRKWRL